MPGSAAAEGALSSSAASSVASSAALFWASCTQQQVSSSASSMGSLLHAGVRVKLMCNLDWCAVELHLQGLSASRPPMAVVHSWCALCAHELHLQGGCPGVQGGDECQQAAHGCVPGAQMVGQHSACGSCSGCPSAAQWSVGVGRTLRSTQQVKSAGC